MYIGNGSSTLTFNATTDRNNTVIECQDLIDGGSDTCTIIITGEFVALIYRLCGVVAYYTAKNLA